MRDVRYKAEGERILDLMKNISGYKTESKMEGLMDSFEQMVTEEIRIDLVSN